MAAPVALLAVAFGVGLLLATGKKGKAQPACVNTAARDLASIVGSYPRPMQLLVAEMLDPPGCVGRCFPAAANCIRAKNASKCQVVLIAAFTTDMPDATVEQLEEVAQLLRGAGFSESAECLDALATARSLKG